MFLIQFSHFWAEQTQFFQTFSDHIFKTSNHSRCSLLDSFQFVCIFLVGRCPKVCTIFQLRSDQQQTEWNDYLLCLSYNTPVNTILKGDLATSFIFSCKDTLLLSCTGFVMHTKSQISSSRVAMQPSLPCDVGANLQPCVSHSSQLNKRQLGSQDAIAQTMMCEQLLLHVSAYNVHPQTIFPFYQLQWCKQLRSPWRILWSLSSPASVFAVFLLKKMVEQGGYTNFTSIREFSCQIAFDPESDTQYLSQGHILKQF